jgi:hypothetical protein
MAEKTRSELVSLLPSVLNFLTILLIIFDQIVGTIWEKAIDKGVMNVCELHSLKHLNYCLHFCLIKCQALIGTAVGAATAMVLFSEF